MKTSVLENIHPPTTLINRNEKKIPCKRILSSQLLSFQINYNVEILLNEFRSSDTVIKMHHFKLYTELNNIQFKESQ